MFNLEELVPIKKPATWGEEVLRARRFLEEGLYSKQEFALKILQLRRQYKVNKYKYNEIFTDFSENL